MKYSIKSKKSKNTAILFGFVLAVSLITSALTVLFTANSQSHSQFQMLASICGEILEKEPAAKQALLAALKNHKNKLPAQAENNFLSAHGYHPSDFTQPPQKQNLLLAALSFILGGALFFFTFRYQHKKEALHIQSLTDYLEQVNIGTAALLLESGEDECSKLRDEIYKTVTMLYQTRDFALEARKNFADNLANIAHQIKTPLTAVSLSTQMLKASFPETPSCQYLEQIQRQVSRLTSLEESLLLLSRIDAGTLVLEQKPADVFTLLTMAFDNLQEEFSRSNISAEIPEAGEIEIYADFNWTMEAVMNLLKNCLEHTPPGGTVRCSYSQNPLYTELLICDEGPGFAKEELPHLFERFYRGQNAKKGGIGIGLSLAKELIERQNGTLRAINLLQGGACFEIRFYCH